MNYYKPLDPTRDTLLTGDEFSIPGEEPEQWYCVRSLADGETFSGDLIYRRLVTVAPCPFCAKAVASLETAEELHGGRNDLWAVVCGFHEGGCGATGGFRESQLEAVELWNHRLNEILEQRIHTFCNDDANAFEGATLLKVAVEKHRDTLVEAMKRVLCSALLKFHRIPARPRQS